MRNTGYGPGHLGMRWNVSGLSWWVFLENTIISVNVALDPMLLVEEACRLVLRNALRRACRQVQLRSECLQVIHVLRVRHVSQLSLVQVIGEPHGATTMQHERRESSNSTHCCSQYEQNIRE